MFVSGSAQSNVVTRPFEPQEEKVDVLDPFAGLALQIGEIEGARVAYIACNELRLNETLRDLQVTPQKQSSVHIGWSFEMNFNIVAERKPDLAIIADINSNTHKAYSFMSAHIRFIDKVEQFRICFF